ncbi:sulfotransferase family protein [Acrocarpospora catenulata]|uniref:sulfotransferase family protein n=1 Tax=Acrocarpospora catenulata TaxID=2836182 RepID=UPI001BD94A6B|nr:sulfotransferase [Acrocarpospora catenulata]
MLKGVPQPGRAELTERAYAYQNPRLPFPLWLAARTPFARLWWPLEPEALKAKARRLTGLTEFGDLAPLDEPLRLLCLAFDEDAELHALGRLTVHSTLVGALVNRLRLEDLARRRPHVFERPVEAPIVIAGLQRSGTTFLHRLLARDPGLRSIPFWEALNPLPLGDVTAPVPAPDPRIEAGARALALIERVSPEIIKMHELENEAPDEELLLLAMGFASLFFETISPVPGYLPWYLTADHTPGYAYLRRTLQAMQWIRPAGERWLLRSPQHLEHLVPLTETFPDGTFVQTHRDPVRSVLSMASTLCHALRQNYFHPNPHLIGSHAADLTERLLRAALRDRSTTDPRFVDVHFTQLNADPLAIVHKVYKAAGMSLTDDAHRLMTVWYPRHRRGRHGIHQHVPADFGLHPDRLRERFAFYYEHFAVSHEGP